MPPRKKKAKKTPPRDDGRRMTSVYLTPEVLGALRNATVVEDRVAFKIVEDALRAYFKMPKHVDED
jgi:hypothetical protein